MRRTMLWSSIVVLLVAVGGAAQATIFSNSTDWTSGRLAATLYTPQSLGVYGNGQWASEDSDWAKRTYLSWEVSWDPYDVDPLFTYQYSFHIRDGAQGALSHLMIGVSDGISGGDLGAFTVNDVEDAAPSITGQGQIGSQPIKYGSGIPESLYAVKYEESFGSWIGDIFELNVWLKTYRAPMWGSFYAADGKAGKTENYAYNIGLEAAPTAGDYIPGEEFKSGYLLVPDSKWGGEEFLIPEPSSVALVILALGAGLYSGGKRLRRKA